MGKPLYMIVARASNGVIGKHGAVPWTLRVDHRHFLDQTKGDCIIIGRRTYEVPYSLCRHVDLFALPAVSLRALLFALLLLCTPSLC